MSNEKKLSGEYIAFIEKWAPFAMEHQIKYGIPASLTLSQMIVESSCGTSNLCKRSNNYFGIKINSNGVAGVDFVYAHDNKPGEKFKIYSSAEDSMQGHSRTLTGDLYRKHCGRLSATDINGWIDGIQKTGYATDPNYSTTLRNLVRDYNLTQYDTASVQMASQRGLTCGYKKNDKEDLKQTTYPPSMTAQSMSQGNEKKLGYIEGNWHMPLADDMRQTGEFGEKRTDHIHQGIDIGIPTGTSVYATEDNGIVTGKGNGSARGNYVEITYPRQNGKDITIIYMHLNSIDVKEGDKVNAGSVIGKSGSTGRSTGPHLHFEVREGGSKGTAIDPKTYLAEIAVRGNLDTTLKKGSEDVLLAHKREFQLIQNENNNLLAENDKKNNNDLLSLLGTGGGDMVSMMFEILIKKMIDLKALEEVYLAEKQKENKTTEITSGDMVKYRSEAVDLKEATRMTSTNYESIVSSESQSQSQRKGIV